MYARVASWEGGDADAIRASADAINSESADGPPEGLPATGIMVLIDPEGGRCVGITLFATEDDMREGDAKLNSMSPPGDGMGTRTSVGFFEVAVDITV